MNQPTTKQQQKKPNPYIVNDNVLESIRGIGTNVGKTLKQDVGRIPSDILGGIVGAPTSGELQQNESIQVQQEHATRQPITKKELLDPFIQKDIQETKAKLESVRQELQLLSKSIKGFHQEVEKAILEMPVNPGVYHINFFEQLRSFIESLRQTIDNGSTWLSAFTANSKKKRGYWGMYKKHGTTFGLSSERTTATQSG